MPKAMATMQTEADRIQSQLSGTLTAIDLLRCAPFLGELPLPGSQGQVTRDHAIEHLRSSIAPLKRRLYVALARRA